VPFMFILSKIKTGEATGAWARAFAALGAMFNRQSSEDLHCCPRQNDRARRQCCSEPGWGLGLVGSCKRDQHPVIDLGAEDSNADALGGELVAVGVGQATDKSGQA